MLTIILQAVFLCNKNTACYIISRVLYMKVSLSQKLMLLSIIQYLYGFGDSFPQIKNCKSDVFQTICINLFCLKNNAHVHELLKEIEGKSLELIYKQVLQSEINNNKENCYISMILETIQEEKVWKDWFCDFSNLFYSQLEYKIKYILDDFNTVEVKKNILQKYNLDVNDLNIIYNGLSNYDYAFIQDNKLYYCAGDFIGFDELEFLEVDTVKKGMLYVHLLSKLIPLQTFNYLKKISKNTLDKCIENINLILPFKKCWNIADDYDFLCLYISFYYVIDELKILYPQTYEYCIKILQSKGIILSNEIFHKEYNPIEIINQINNLNIQGLFISRLPTKDDVNTLLLKYTDYYTTENEYTFKKQLSQITRDNFFIFIGEFHKCDEHYHFITKCMNEFFQRGFENIFWEKSKDFQDEINDYIFNISNVVPTFLMLRERKFIEKVRELNQKNNNKFHIYCYDLSYEEFNSQNFTLNEREKKCFLEIKKNINNKKSIFLSGFLHCKKKIIDDSIFSDGNIYSKLKSDYIEKNIYSFFINAFLGRFLTYQNNKPVNWDINVTTSFIEPYDITALIYKKTNEISFVNFNHNLNVCEKYIGYTEFGNISFDNNISTLSSGGFTIHKLGEDFDGMIIYPSVDWMNGEM